MTSSIATKTVHHVDVNSWFVLTPKEQDEIRAQFTCNTDEDFEEWDFINVNGFWFIADEFYGGNEVKIDNEIYSAADDPDSNEMMPKVFITVVQVE